MSTADPITQTGEIYPDTLDPMLEAIRQSIIDAGADIDPDTEPSEMLRSMNQFTAGQVVIIEPDAEDEQIDASIMAAVGMATGLCLLILAGGATNPDPNAPGPRLKMELEFQLFIDSHMRGREAIQPLKLVCALMKYLHHTQVRVSGFPWYEELYSTGFQSLPDPDYTAYTLTFDRDFQL